MLARTPKFTCVECAKTEFSPTFQWYHDEPDQGPAYWSAKGVLCSAACAQAHFKGLQAAGQTPAAPADEPF